MRITGMRNLKCLLLFVVIFICAVNAQHIYAETQYVSDTLVITMREGKGTEFKIIKTLKTGTPLEILEEDGHYIRVRTQEGKEGWVLKQYVTSDTPKAAIIAGMEKKIKQLKDRIGELEQKRSLIQDELNATQNNHADRVKELNQSILKNKEQAEQTAKELKEITGRYNTLVEHSRNVVDLVSERDRLKASNEMLSTETEQLRQENERLVRTNMIQWFLAGAGVFFVGWIAGKASRKKRYY